MNLSIGLSASARTRPLVDHRVAIDGVNATVTIMGVQALFNLQMRRHTFDVCEFPIVTYLRSLEQTGAYLAVPVFPSRHFRLSCIFVGANGGICRPADLAGRRIGLSVFDMAAAVWLRGILHDYHGVDRFAPTYVIGGLEGPRADEEHPQFYPDGFSIEHRRDAGLAQLLAVGEIDAVVTARAPSSWPGPHVRRLFERPRDAELDYYRTTGIFPAMHVLAVKRDIAEQFPELPVALYNAFVAAHRLARHDLVESAALDSVLPWQLEELLETEQALGADYWPAGVAANVPMLQRIVDYTLADGLIGTAFRPQDLFSGPGEHQILAT